MNKCSLTKGLNISKYDEIVKERYEFVIFLQLVLQKYESSMWLLTRPSFIKRHFACYLRSPLHANKATLKGHTAKVTCLAVGYNALYSGSYDGTIRIWNKKEPL